MGPAAERHRDVVDNRRAVVHQPPVCLGDVLGEDAQRDPVDHDVVRDDQQAAQIAEPHERDHPADSRVETAHRVVDDDSEITAWRIGDG
ncbi:hypothetical protein GCM10007298_07090 [Williamsia phyllosphaerae]|uniref:Uncharacterized protein n=1 Tax=Williamsia phyllosphaerae TaxID=885042 RepID=A0ABQ1U9D8_9NOCA|nr:hypothetical protein GCM10007298_07090 [Williamsia phyllosphaerae]